jgi:hypothetical protein
MQILPIKPIDMWILPTPNKIKWWYPIVILGDYQVPEAANDMEGNHKFENQVTHSKNTLALLINVHFVNDPWKFLNSDNLKNIDDLPGSAERNGRENINHHHPLHVVEYNLSTRVDFLTIRIVIGGIHLQEDIHDKDKRKEDIDLTVEELV